MNKVTGVSLAAGRWGPILVLSAAVLGAAGLEAQPALPETIPLFPLEEVMLFPGVPRPLHIFEPRYREMLLDALVGDRIIGMVMLMPGFESDYEGRPPIHAIGCAGTIANVEELPDGRYNIVLQGLTRFRVVREDRSRSYRIGEIVPLPEAVDANEEQALAAHRPRLLEMLSGVGSAPAPTREQMPDEELVNGLSQFFPMSPEDRYRLLEQNGPLERAKALIAIEEEALVPRR